MEFSLGRWLDSGHERVITVGGLRLMEDGFAGIARLGRWVFFWVRILVEIRVRCLVSLVTVHGCALGIVFDSLISGLCLTF